MSQDSSTYYARTYMLARDMESFKNDEFHPIEDTQLSVSIHKEQGTCNNVFMLHQKKKTIAKNTTSMIRKK